MAGNKESAQKAQQALKARLGLEGYTKHMEAIGAKGGKASVPKGLSFTRNLPEFVKYYRRQVNV